MKKSILFTVFIFSAICVFAAGPRLDSVTLSNGDSVIMFDSDSYNKFIINDGIGAHVGEYSLGQVHYGYGGRASVSYTATVSFSYETRTYEGTIYFNSNTGSINYVEFNGNTFTDPVYTNRRVVRRR